MPPGAAGSGDRILYKTSGPNPWTVTVGLDPNGDLRVVSGDTRREWHLVVATADHPALVRALGGADASGPLLDLVTEHFSTAGSLTGSDQNPYQPIRQFLGDHGIPHTTTTW